MSSYYSIVMTKVCQVFIIFLFGSFLLLFGPFLWCFTRPLTHDYIKTDHPPSPHKPPSSYRLTQEQVKTFKEDGVLILRQVMPPDLMAKLSMASDDIATNRTVHCDMSKYHGPPIFHSYSLLCHQPDFVHDVFRDAVLHSPLSQVASQLMGDTGVRIFNTFSMGVEAEKVVPLRLDIFL